MKSLTNFRLWLSGSSGVTAVEYALIGGAIACGILATIFLVGDNLQSIIEGGSAAMENAAARGP